MITCRHCGRPVELDNTDDIAYLRFLVPPEVIENIAWPYSLPGSPLALGDFWRHSDTGEPGSGFVLCPGTKRYTASARYAEPSERG